MNLSATFAAKTFVLIQGKGPSEMNLVYSCFIKKSAHVLQFFHLKQWTSLVWDGSPPQGM